ncbi:hypothetical protein HNR46_003439 [Haloferula luteola]|uniref:Uncharacterized protein n=1 Tax=Haloferula luteola TaxID=595692 RepID=A0A840V591_9BACT|nr:hypothetical protein [Haloferula luteola]MBB5353185.1 hypothetical protein [Haloferula luteola]
MIRPLLLLLLVCGVSQAINVRFLAWDETVAAREIVAASGATGGKEITALHPLKRTDAVSMTAVDGKLILRTPDKTGPDDKPAEMAVPLPETVTRPLVVLLPDAKSPTGLRGFALNDSTQGFAWGTYRMINATPKELNLAFGKKRLRLPTGWKAVDVETSGEGSESVWMSTADNPNKALYTNVWSTSPEIRRLVFIVPGTDPRLGPLALKIIPEDRRNLAEAE